MTSDEMRAGDDSPEMIIDGLVFMGYVRVYEPDHTSWLKELTA